MIQYTPELARITALPVRSETIDPEVVSGFFRRRPGVSLRPLQAQALFEAWQSEGLFGALGVGVGKTLISLLLPTLFRAVRPLLLVPAKLVEKTRRDLRALSTDWHVATHLRIESYELLGRVSAARLLEQYEPDMITADECHKLRNPRAAVTRRVDRYMRQRPDTRFVGLSGTVTKRSLLDYAHLVEWSLGAAHAPLPMRYTDLHDWDSYLSARPTESDPGALTSLCARGESVHAAYARRLTSTVGVVASDASACDATLVIDRLPAPPPPALADVLAMFERDWLRPDGWALADAKDMWRVRRELTLGFYYRWDPEPPVEWLSVRAAWAKACREVLSGNRRGLDSSLAVIQACDRGELRRWAGESDPVQSLADWRGIKESFKPNTIPVWIDRFIGPIVQRWLEGRAAIVWVQHSAVADMLSEATGLRVYREGGMCGRYFIDDHPADWSLIATIGSNAEGRNLQRFSESLVIPWPSNGPQCEQLLGRTHRPGQDADEVRYTILDSDPDALDKSRADAAYIQGTTNQPQKLLLATYV